MPQVAPAHLPTTREEGLAEEVRYWTEVIRSRDAGYPGNFAFAMDPLGSLQERFSALLPANEGHPVTILDVGAGPYTMIGKVGPNDLRPVITAIDPLADAYNAILDRHEHRPPVRTKALAGEDISHLYEPCSFDLVHARNSLDHAENPLLCIVNMMSVCKVGGFVYLHHHAREGETQSYRDIHQWNFDLHEGAPVLERPCHPPTSGFARFAIEVHLRLEGFDFLAEHRRVEGDWLISIFRKTKDRGY